MKNECHKSFARDWVPPAILRFFGRHLGTRLRFEGEFKSWEEATARCAGYQAGHILAKVLEATLKVKHGEAAYERDSVIFDQIEYAWPLLAGLMWSAARNNGTLSVLDFGGALGSSYFQNRNYLNSLTEVRWSIVEQPHYVDAGRAQLQDDQLRFYTTVDECLAENQPNVVLLSGVLQYLENPSDIMDSLARYGASSVIIDRTPFSSLLEHKLLIQRTPAQIYEASYPMWVFGLEPFMRTLERNWVLISKMPGSDGQFFSANGLAFSFEGMLLEGRA